jgi:hypothetical protein
MEKRGDEVVGRAVGAKSPQRRETYGEGQAVG